MCFEMTGGGLFFQVSPLTLGMCCFPQWEKLIPCLGWVGWLWPTQLSHAWGMEVRDHQIIPFHYHAPKWGMHVLDNSCLFISSLCSTLMPGQLSFQFQCWPIMFPAALGVPKGGAAPSFGKVAKPAPKGPDRPTPQPHPQDLNSLVQRAEHIPAGTRTPMCNKCNNVIR